MKSRSFFRKIVKFWGFFAFLSHRGFDSNFVILANDSLKTSLQSYWPKFWYSSTSGPEKNWQGQFCLKTNSLVNLYGFESRPNWWPNFKSLETRRSFDAFKILVCAWPPTYRLPSAWFSADLKQLQNRDFATSNRSKTIRVLTRNFLPY